MRNMIEDKTVVSSTVTIHSLNIDRGETRFAMKGYVALTPEEYEEYGIDTDTLILFGATVSLVDGKVTGCLGDYILFEFTLGREGSAKFDPYGCYGNDNPLDRITKMPHNVKQCTQYALFSDWS